MVASELTEVASRQQPPIVLIVLKSNVHTLAAGKMLSDDIRFDVEARSPAVCCCQACIGAHTYTANLSRPIRIISPKDVLGGACMTVHISLSRTSGITTTWVELTIQFWWTCVAKQKRHARRGSARIAYL